jgi:hypothetical protein
LPERTGRKRYTHVTSGRERWTGRVLYFPCRLTFQFLSPLLVPTVKLRLEIKQLGEWPPLALTTQISQK